MRDSNQEFSKATLELLAKRVGYRCSNPSCRRPTIGPNSNEQKVKKNGEAAHIRAASPGGMRYDPTMTSQQRRAAANGIWLCGNCHKLVDSDQKYTVGLLYRWKQQAEEMAMLELESSAAAQATADDVELMKFFIQCMDRPAFQDPLCAQRRSHDPLLMDFEQAVRDTIIALNTGVQRTREGDILQKAAGKSQVRNPEWRERLGSMVQILTKILHVLQEARTPDGTLCYDRNLHNFLERRRDEAMELINSVCRDLGLHELEGR